MGAKRDFLIGWRKLEVQRGVGRREGVGRRASDALCQVGEMILRRVIAHTMSLIASTSSRDEAAIVDSA